MRKLPATVPHHLLHPSRHARNQIRKPQLATDRLDLLLVFRARWPAPGHGDVEQQRRGQDVVFVVLGHTGSALAPALGPQAVMVESAQQQQAARRLAQPAQKRGQGRLARARWSFEKNALPAPDVDVASSQHRIQPTRVAEADVAANQQPAPA